MTTTPNVQIPQTCPECGGTEIQWTTTAINTSGVADGRLRMHDIRVCLVLGCEECSETILVIDADSTTGLVLLESMHEARENDVEIAPRDARHIHKSLR